MQSRSHVLQHALVGIEAEVREVLHTLVGLGRYDDAEQLFYDRLNKATLYRLAAHRERIEWLERLFPEGLEGLPALTDESDQAFMFSSLGVSYQFSGQPGRSVSLCRRADEIYELQGNKEYQQIILSNLGVVLHEVGALRVAAGALLKALFLNRELGDKFWEGVSLKEFGRVLTTTGDSTLSLVALKRSQYLDARRTDAQGEGLAICYFAERSLSLGDFAVVNTMTERAWDLAAVRRFERDFIRAALLQGQAALGLSDLERADERLHHAITRARAVNVVEFELPALIATAELEIQQENLVGAEAMLNEAWDAAKRGPYPIHQADAYNILADIERVKGNKKAAIEAATKAYEAAWCDGPPYAYHWGLEKAKAHLNALAAPKPEMPAFDESQHEPLPISRSIRGTSTG